MSLRPVREFCPVLSKREREQNSSLHSCSKTGRTGLEQLEQVKNLPIWTCSNGIEQLPPKQPFVRCGKLMSCSNTFRTAQNGLRHLACFFILILSELAPNLWTYSPWVSPRESTALSTFLSSFNLHENVILLQVIEF